MSGDVSAIVFLPLLGFLIAGLFGRLIGAAAVARSSRRACSSSAAVLSWIVFFAGRLSASAASASRSLGNWFTSARCRSIGRLRIDTLTVVMLVVVNDGVGARASLFDRLYAEDPARPRFFAYLSLFTFAMLMLVTADNLVQMFFGWEGVGLASYLLIGFWYEKPSANAAAIKAFVVNRVGDFGFALGIFLVFC